MAKLGIFSADELRSVPAMKWEYNAEMMQCGGFSFARDYELFTEGLQDAFDAGHYPKIPMLIGSTYEERLCRRDEHYTIEMLCEEVHRRFGDSAEEFMRIYHPQNDEQALLCRNQAFSGDKAHAAVRFMAKQAARFQRQIYVYRFAQEPPHMPEVYGSNHSDDVPYWFGALSCFDYEWTERDNMVSRYMVRALASFVKSRNPNVSCNETWPDYADQESVCVIGPREGNEIKRIEGNDQPDKWCLFDRVSAYRHLLNEMKQRLHREEPLNLTP